MDASRNEDNILEIAEGPPRKLPRGVGNQNRQNQILIGRVDTTPLRTADDDDSESEGEIERALESSWEVTLDILRSTQDALQTRQGDRVLYVVKGVAGPISIRERDEAGLQTDAWLTDPVVNSFGWNACQELSTVCFFESFFFHNDRDECVSTYPAIHVRNRGISANCKLLLVPVNTGNRHWTLITAQLQDRTLSHYDSLSQGVSERRIRALFRLLGDAIDVNFSREKGAQEWNLVICGNCPRQTNSSDCGVYVCYLMEHLVKVIERGTDINHGVVDALEINAVEFRARILKTLRDMTDDAHYVYDA